MPCGGGYVDKEISLDSGYQNKINGNDVNYGNKSIAVISTSDNRFEDGRELGSHSTWIKWAEPTAEAIRQACLAKESRISQMEPELPQIFIKSIDVTTSKFLGSFDINLNKQYNAFIGGRGTGKSTILEYLRWGLCDQTVISSSLEEIGFIEERRKGLIQKTLTDVGGEVRITMIKNGTQHIVKRNSESKEVLLRIGEGEFEQVKEEDIRKILPIQSYSQKQLSDVGVKTEELKRFIEQPIADSLNSIKSKLKETGAKLKGSYNQLIRKRETEREIEDFRLESKSLNNQADNLRKLFKGISKEDQETINKKTKFEEEEIIISKSKKELGIFENKADELLELLENYPESLADTEQLENKELIKDITDEIHFKFEEIKVNVSHFKSIFSQGSLEKLNSYIDDWNNEKTSFDTAYEKAKNKSSSSQQQLSEVQKIEEQISEINQIISERLILLKEIGSPEEEFSGLREKWHDLHEEKIKLLNKQAIEFTKLSKDLIKAEVEKNIDLSTFKNNLKSVLEGTRIREDRIDALMKKIMGSDNPMGEYESLLEELRQLSELKISEDKTFAFPETPILTECEYNDNHKSKICNKMTTDDWLKIAVNELEFNPKFFYTTNNQLGDTIPFKDASAGQQATALLTVLLNQSGMPLIIDQPEDDIDNKAIEQIIKNIWDAKKKRQLIFTSHNANLVVNGDAELVICCDYKDSTSQTRGIIKEEGAIDKEKIRNEVTSIMEGGEKAFKLRKDKYGF